ncbi:unnamed protein product [Kuraishia capsulata CBS 1993]|uniref:Uncharacterized protein n=1 Tax=Kuraishia capsulata CBS 1993 TaxID=1382522 RepID=W6MFE9_9ASCO|nr:uncharacterized protein KUCA_T00000473001 [Kuraishia capsulata CBS 1993]CDK24509.1 unnamed protein product [Kuraishia capsulata CBS 1993]
MTDDMQYAYMRRVAYNLKLPKLKVVRRARTEGEMAGAKSKFDIAKLARERVEKARMEMKVEDIDPVSPTPVAVPTVAESRQYRTPKPGQNHGQNQNQNQIQDTNQNEDRNFEKNPVMSLKVSFPIPTVKDTSSAAKSPLPLALQAPRRRGRPTDKEREERRRLELEYQVQKPKREKLMERKRAEEIKQIPDLLTDMDFVSTSLGRSLSEMKNYRITESKAGLYVNRLRTKRGAEEVDRFTVLADEPVRSDQAWLANAATVSDHLAAYRTVWKLLDAKQKGEKFSRVTSSSDEDPNKKARLR